MNNLSFCWNCWIRCVEIEVICVALIFFIAFLFCNSCNIVAVSTCIHPAFARKFRLWQLWKMFLVLTIWLIPANGGVSYSLPLFPSLVNGLVLLVIGGRTMPTVPFSRAWSTRCYRSSVALHRSLVPVISWLSRPVPWITYCLGDFVVPFSNAKVVGSFRMARLNVFRRTGA